MKPNWQRLAMIRNNNRTVLGLVAAGVDDLDDIASRTGLTLPEVRVVVRRLSALGDLEYAD